MKMSSDINKATIDHKIFIFDGDIIGYKVAWATQTEIDWGDGETVDYNLAEAQATADSYINNILSELRDPNWQGVEQVIIALSDPTGHNFRKVCNPSYKEQRKDTKKPAVFKPIIEYLKKRYLTMDVHGLEADDVMGILATKEYPAGTEVTMVSIDKDMKTIPGRFYSSDKKELCITSEFEADYNFLLQTLTGDAIDNYKGIPGIGPVKAKAILADLMVEEDSKSGWELVVNAYLDAGLTEEDAIMNARMARILRYGDYIIDYNTGEMKLWQPDSSMQINLEDRSQKRQNSTTSGGMTALQLDQPTMPSTK